MNTDMECRTLGEDKGNYTHTNVRQIKQKDSGYAHEGSGNTKLAVGLLAGVGVGVLAGMLLAPERGRDLRRQVANSAAKVGDQVTKSFGAAKDKVSNWTGQSDSGATYEDDDFLPANSTDVHKSPYTNENKWSDEELRDLTRNPRHTPDM